MSFPSGHKDDKRKGEVASIPPSLSDLHCFTETEGVITTSSCPLSLSTVPVHYPLPMLPTRRWKPKNPPSPPRMKDKTH